MGIVRKAALPRSCHQCMSDIMVGIPYYFRAPDGYCLACGKRRWPRDFDEAAERFQMNQAPKKSQDHAEE